VKIKQLLVWATVFVVLLLALFTFDTQSASLPKPPYIVCPNCPKVVGKGTLGPTEYDPPNNRVFSVLTVYDRRIKPTDVVIHSVASPDEMQKGHRVSIYRIDYGILQFWVTGEEGHPTAEQPEVHYAVYEYRP
jgi:hypothetical protein